MLKVFPINKAWNYLNYFKEEILVADICLILYVALLWELEDLIDYDYFFFEMIHINLALFDDSYKSLEWSIETFFEHLLDHLLAFSTKHRHLGENCPHIFLGRLLFEIIRED